MAVVPLEHAGAGRHDARRVRRDRGRTTGASSGSGWPASGPGPSAARDWSGRISRRIAQVDPPPGDLGGRRRPGHRPARRRRAPRGPVVLDDVDWAVRPGERWVILGPNGSGKTTLLTLAGARLVALAGRGGDPRLAPGPGRCPHAAAPDLAGQRLGDPQLRADLPARDVVVSGRYGALETWWHTYSDEDWARGRPAARRGRIRRHRRPPLRGHLRRRAPAGAAGPGAHGPPRAAPARRAGGRARPGRPGAPGVRGWACWPPTPQPHHWCWSPTTARRSRAGSPTPAWSARAGCWRPGRWTTCSPRHWSRPVSTSPVTVGQRRRPMVESRRVHARREQGRRSACHAIGVESEVRRCTDEVGAAHFPTIHHLESPFTRVFHRSEGRSSGSVDCDPAGSRSRTVDCGAGPERLAAHSRAAGRRLHRPLPPPAPAARARRPQVGHTGLPPAHGAPGATDATLLDLAAASSRPKLVLLRPVDDGAVGRHRRRRRRPLRAGGRDRDARAAGEPGADPRRSWPAYRRQQARQRCTVVLRFLTVAAISTGLLGVLPSLRLAWIFTALTGLAALALVGLIAYAREVEGQRRPRPTSSRPARLDHDRSPTLRPSGLPRGVGRRRRRAASPGRRLVR